MGLCRIINFNISQKFTLNSLLNIMVFVLFSHLDQISLLDLKILGTFLNNFYLYRLWFYIRMGEKKSVHNLLKIFNASMIVGNRFFHINTNFVY